MSNKGDDDDRNEIMSLDEGLMERSGSGRWRDGKVAFGGTWVAVAKGGIQGGRTQSS